MRKQCRGRIVCGKIKQSLDLKTVVPQLNCMSLQERR